MTPIGGIFILHLSHQCDMINTEIMRAIFEQTHHNAGNRSAPLPGQALAALCVKGQLAYSNVLCTNGAAHV